MDFETKPTSRHDIRKLAAIMRTAFKVPCYGVFPVLQVLEILPELFKDCCFEIIEDDFFPPNTMAGCTKNPKGGYTIKIRESVYDGAYRDGNGAFLGFICHEICHVFLFKIGFTPIVSHARDFSESNIPAFRSVEWQAKALCGEVMMPFQEIKGKTIQEIVDEYHVSRKSAAYQSRLAREEIKKLKHR